MIVENFKAFFESDIVMVEPGTLHMDTELQSLEDWDSLAYISLNVYLDEHHGFTLSTIELQSLKTFGDIVDHIHKHSA